LLLFAEATFQKHQIKHSKCTEVWSHRITDACQTNYAAGSNFTDTV